MGTQDTADYLGYIGDLRWALDLPEIKQALQLDRPSTGAEYVRRWQSLPPDSDVFQNTVGAYWLVSTLGFCRMFDVTLPSDVTAMVQAPLPVEIIAPGLNGLLHALDHLKQDAQELPERFDDAEAVEDVALCTSILHQLMQTWAAFIILDENYQEYLNAGGSSSAEFSKWLDRVLAGFESVDDVTQREEQMRLLSIATDLPLLENWRGMMRGSYKELPPWWLDGTLERIAADGPTEGNKVVAPLSTPAVVLRFEPAETMLQLAASASEDVFVLKSAEATELRILPNPRDSLKTLLLLPAPAGKVGAIEVEGKEIELVEPWDDDGEAVVRADDINAVLEGRAALFLRLAS